MLRCARVLCIVFFVVSFACRASAEPTVIAVTAQNIALYNDRNVVLADGGVVVAFGPATISAPHAILDLVAHTLTLYGGVSEKISGTTTTGQTYRLDIATVQGRLLATSSVEHVVATSPLVTAQQMVIRPGIDLRFTSATVYGGNGSQPAATYTFPLLAVNARNFGPPVSQGAALELPVRLRQSARWFVYGDGQYDRYLGGFGASVEAHLANSSRGYIAFAATPTQQYTRYDLAALGSIKPGLTQTFSAARAPGLRFARYALTAFGRRGSLQGVVAQNLASRSDDLVYSTPRLAIGSALFVSAATDLGHDIHPFDYAIAQDARSGANVTLSTQAVHFASAAVSFQGSVGGTMYTYGRRSGNASVGAFATRSFGRVLQTSLGLSLTQYNDVIGPYPRSTQRTLSVSVGYRPHAPWSLFTAMSYAHDFPQFFGIGRGVFTQSLALRVHRKRGISFEIDGSYGLGGIGINPRPTLGFFVIR
ncbi:MAG: hypothetical protein ACYDA1_02700 [Vulcanimicrobiaceae bacterium]